MFFKQKQRFSIRKYSFGAASVLLGTVILGMAAPEASADTVQPETQQVLKEENTSVQTSDLSSPEMEAVSETPEIQSQEKLVQSTDTPIAEPVVASENPEGAATSVHATRVPSTDIPVTELADPSESAEVPATQVQETPAPSADTPVAEPVAAGESPEGDETSAQEENHPAPSALISDTADKPHVRSARSLPDSPADEQNLFEDQNLLGDVQNTLVDKTDLKELIGGRDAFKPTAGYTEGGKEEQDAYDKAIVAGEAVFNDASAKQEAVDTAIRNIKEADTRLRLSAAAALVKAAEEAAKAAQAKKQEVEQDATVDTDEEKAVDDLNKKTLGKITSARNVVDLLPEVAGKAPLKDRLDKIKTSGVVVGIVGTAIARAELHTRLTEQAARAAAAKKREVEADGAVNPAEKVEVDALNAEVTKFKKLAEQSVGNLPESREKTEFKDRLSKATTSEVVINDFDKDGKADEQDILEAAEASVQAADDMAQIVKSKKAAAESDGNVTQEEKTKIDDLNEAITANKEFAKSKVDNLPDSPDKAALKKWLDKITTSEVTVGSADNKVKSDKSDTAIARADFFTTSTESKAKAAAAKKKEVEADGAVNPAEKAEVDALNGQVANSKKLAEQFVDTLPEGQEKKEFKDRLSKVTTSGVKINDADSNGKSDELENRLSGFENIIRTAQASVQEAKDKKAEVEKDGFVTAEEKQAVDSLNAGITNVKEILKKFIDTLPEIPVKKDLSDRVAKLTTSEVTLGAVDSKGKATPNEAAALGLVKTLLTSAEQAAQKAQAKKTEVESDGVVTEAEKAEVDKLNTQITDSKKQLSTVLENLAAGTEKDGFKERFDKLTTSEVTVGAVDNSKDKADSQEEQGIVPIGSGDVAQRTLKDTEAAVESIEKMAQIVKAAAKDAESDGLVTPEEKASIDNLNKDLKTQKEHVASKVDNLSDSPDKAALKERLAKVTTVEVAVNDADSNGKVDAEEVAALRTAKNLATDAEQLVQSAKTKKAEAESDGVVTSEEKAEIDSLNTRITNSQKDLSTLLDNLADSTEKTALKERLAKLTTSEVTVGDVDSKIKSDKLKNAIARADFFTTSTEKAAQTAAAKKQEVEADGVVNPAEKQEVDALNAEVTKSKKLAEQLIDTLPENSETKELKARLAKVTTADVTVNDADNDGKVDSKVEQGADNTGKVDNKDEQTADNTGKADSQAEQDLALMDAKAAVKAAEDSAQFAKDKKTELEKDGAINQSEKAHLDRLNIFITADKKQAQSFVDKLPNGEAKTALQERLDKVTTVEVTVNDVNNDGKADNKEQQDIVPVVADDTTDSKDKADNKDEQADAPVAADDTANKGGLSDSQKITLDAAKAFTESAEEAAKKAQDRKAEVEKDGTVTAEEKQAVDSLNKNVTQAKNSATELVNSLPDNRDTADLKARLDKVTTADVTVGTVDSKDKVDSKDEQADAPVAAADNDGKVDSKVEQSADNTGKVDNKAEQAADNNGKSDSQAEQEAAVKAADLAVKDAEEAAQFAKDKKTELEKDGVINQSEKGHLDLLNTITTGAKQHAQSLVDKLSNGEAKTALQERLDKVTTVEVTVNDLNNDGKADNKEQQGIVPVVADDTTDSKDKADNKDEQSTDNNDTADSQAERDVALIDAQEAVKDAEDTAQFGKDNKAEAEKDGVITPSEKEHLDQIDISITAAKEYAQGLVDKLPDSDAKKALQERLAKVTTVEVTVSDVNNDSKADNKEQQDIVPVVADDTTDSKDKADNKDEQVADNTGKADSKDEQSDAPVAADDSDGKVDSKVEQSADNDGKIDNKDEQSADNTGKADSQAERDVALRHAQQAVEDAEEAAQFGKDNKAEAEKDGVITPSEKEHLDQIDTIITAAKQHAQGLVDELPDSDAKKALQERLAKITTSEVTVNDADSNGKADDKERLEKAEAAVKSVEALAQSAKDKKKEVESDGVVNPAEKEEVDRLNEKVTVNKDFVTSLINDNLPDSPEKAAFMDRLAKITTSEVTVNDADSNGKADSQDKQEAALAAAEAAEDAAEDAAKAGQEKKAEVEKDGLVNPLEKTVVDGLNKTTVDKKNVASALVDTLPDSSAKTALEVRLAKVMISEVAVNDADSNGKVDSQEIEKPQVEPKPDDSPKVEKPQVEPKPGDSPKVEKPQMDPKPDDSPKVEKPQVEPKPGDSPKVEKPQVEPKPGDSPKVEKPQVEPKPGDSPKVEKPQMDPKSGDSDGGITGKAGQTVLPTVSKPAARAISSQPVKKTSSTDTVKGENLPRTGERSNQLAPLYGGGMALALATLLASKKRKRNSED